MTDFIVILVVILIVGAALAYIIRAKKAGVKCIGCPFEESCSSHADAKETSCSGGCEHCSGCIRMNK